MDVSLYMQMIVAVTPCGLRLNHFEWVSRTGTRVYIKEGALKIFGKQWAFVEHGVTYAERVSTLLKGNDNEAHKEWNELCHTNLGI